MATNFEAKYGTILNNSDADCLTNLFKLNCLLFVPTPNTVMKMMMIMIMNNVYYVNCVGLKSKNNTKYLQSVFEIRLIYDSYPFSIWSLLYSCMFVLYWFKKKIKMCIMYVVIDLV